MEVGCVRVPGEAEIMVDLRIFSGWVPVLDRVGALGIGGGFDLARLGRSDIVDWRV